MGSIGFYRVLLGFYWVFIGPVPYLWARLRASRPPGTLQCARKPAIVMVMVMVMVIFLVNQKLTHFIKLVLVKDDVEHLGRTLGELLSGHQLHIDVPRLRLSSEHGGHADADGHADDDADVLMVLVMLMLMVLMLIPSPGT